MPYSIIIVCAVVVFIGFTLRADAEERRPRVFMTEQVFMPVPDRFVSADLRRHDLSAKLELVINPDGRVRSATVIKSSGNKTLDAIATENFRTWNFAGRGCDIVFVPLTITTEQRRPRKHLTTR